MKTKLFLLLISISSYNLFSSTCIASAGNWSENIWSCGRPPSCGDSIVIPAGVTVNVDVMVDLTTGACADPNCLPVALNVLGTLRFNAGKKMTFCDNSVVYFGPSGQIDPGGGGGNSNLLTIGTTVVWNADQGIINSTTNPTPMPVELTSFYAIHQSNKIILHWETATEINNRNFDIERSTDGINFKKIGIQNTKAANGNSVIKLQYDFTDAETGNGTSYYRLKQNDFNGVYKYSPITTVDIEKGKNIMFTVYPNPNQGQFTVDFSGVENNHEIEIIMYDQQGKVVYSNTITSKSIVTNTYDVIPTGTISNGIYMVNFIVEGIKYPVKVLVQ